MGVAGGPGLGTLGRHTTLSANVKGYMNCEVESGYRIRENFRLTIVFRQALLPLYCRNIKFSPVW